MDSRASTRASSQRQQDLLLPVRTRAIIRVGASVVEHAVITESPQFLLVH